jgi:hypothetical protein
MLSKGNTTHSKIYGKNTAQVNMVDSAIEVETADYMQFVVRKGGKEGAGRNSGMTVELEYLHSYVC